MSHRPASIAAALALLLVTSAPHADEREEDSSEAGVSVGSRRPEAPFPSARAMDSQRPDRPSSTAAALLDGLPGLSLFEALPLGGTPCLRGLCGRRLAVLVDGLRLETTLTPFGSDDLLGLIEPLELRRVELLRGPAPIAQGSGAIGGALDLQRPHLSPDPHLAWDARGELRTVFDSGRLGALGRLAASGQLRGVAVGLTAALRRLDDLQSGRGGRREPFTFGADAHAGVEVAWAPRRGQLLTASYELLRQPDQPRTDRSVWNNLALLDRSRDVVRLSYSAEEPARRLGSLQATVRFRDERRLGRVLGLDGQAPAPDLAVSSLDGRLSMTSDLGRHRLSYGLDLAHDWARAVERDLINKGRALTVEAFGVDQITLGSRLALELGARAGASSLSAWYDRVYATYAGGLHARYLLGSGLNLVAGVSQGYLTPNLDDIAFQGCGDRGFAQASDDLIKEKSLTGEAGLKLDLYGVLTANLFYSYTHLFDPITTRARPSFGSGCGGATPESGYYLGNADQARIHAVDASATLEWRRWRLHTWLSWAWGSITDPLDPSGPDALDRVPPLSGYAALRYQLGWAKAHLEAAIHWAASQDRLGAEDRLDPRFCPDGGGWRATPAPGGVIYACVTAPTPADFSLSLRGGLEVLRWLRLSLALENLTHQRYRAFASGVPAPGISALLGMEVSAP